MDCFQIAGTGFGIQIPGKNLSPGKYLRNFRVPESYYAGIENKINIHIEEKVFEISEAVSETGGRVIWEERGKKYLASAYGHCRYAAAFSPADWKEDEIIVKLDPNIYREYSFNMNQLLSITGLHSPLLARGGLTVHASYIETGDGVNRQGVLFTGPSGMGKSTQAELWSRFADARIINGDRTVVRREKDGWKAHGIPVCGSSQICENESLPIRIIIVLAQGIENRVEEIKEGEKYRALLLASAFYQWDAYESEKVHELITELISEVPIIRLVCRPDKGAVRTVQKYIAQDSITQERKSRG